MPELLLLCAFGIGVLSGIPVGALIVSWLNFKQLEHNREEAERTTKEFWEDVRQMLERKTE